MKLLNFFRSKLNKKYRRKTINWLFNNGYGRKGTPYQHMEYKDIDRMFHF